MSRLRNVLIQAILLVFIASTMSPEMRPVKEESIPTVDQIIDHMREHEAYQSKELKHYEAVRHYHVRYKGLVNISAKMDVEINYDAASGKRFRILSQSGSKLLVGKVLKRAVESEKKLPRISSLPL